MKNQWSVSASPVAKSPITTVSLSPFPFFTITRKHAILLQAICIVSANNNLGQTRLFHSFILKMECLQILILVCQQMHCCFVLFLAHAHSLCHIISGLSAFSFATMFDSSLKGTAFLLPFSNSPSPIPSYLAAPANHGPWPWRCGYNNRQHKATPLQQKTSRLRRTLHCQELLCMGNQRCFLSHPLPPVCLSNTNKTTPGNYASNGPVVFTVTYFIWAQVSMQVWQCRGLPEPVLLHPEGLQWLALREAPNLTVALRTSCNW